MCRTISLIRQSPVCGWIICCTDEAKRLVCLVHWQVKDRVSINWVMAAMQICPFKDCRVRLDHLQLVYQGKWLSAEEASAQSILRSGSCRSGITAQLWKIWQSFSLTARTKIFKLVEWTAADVWMNLTRFRRHSLTRNTKPTPSKTTGKNIMAVMRPGCKPIPTTKSMWTLPSRFPAVQRYNPASSDWALGKYKTDDLLWVFTVALMVLLPSWNEDH